MFLAVPSKDGVHKGVVCPPGVRTIDKLPLFKYREARKDFDPENFPSDEIIGYLEVEGMVCRLPLPTKPVHHFYGTVVSYLGFAAFQFF